MSNNLITTVWSEADWNIGFEEFSPAEVTIRANCIMDTVSELLTIYEDNPNNAEGFLAAGKINEVEGDLPFAVKWYDRAIGMNPDFAEAYFRKAAALLSYKQYEDGLAAAAKVVALAPNGVFPALVRRRPLSSYTIYGDALRLNGDDAGAKAAYATATQKEPTDMYASGYYGYYLLQDGSISDGMAQLENVDRANGILGPLYVAVAGTNGDPSQVAHVINNTGGLVMVDIIA